MAGNISPDKARVVLSLREKPVKEFKALTKALKLPTGFLSFYVDHCVIGLLPVLRAVNTMNESGKYSEAEIMAAIFQGAVDSEKDEKLQLDLFGNK